MTQMPQRAESGYFRSKEVRHQIKVFTADTVLKDYKDEQIAVDTPADQSTYVRVTLLKAVPGRVIEAHVSAACKLILVPATGEALSLHTGVQQSANVKINSACVGGSIKLRCINPGVWACESYVGTWKTTTM